MAVQGENTKPIPFHQQAVVTLQSTRCKSGVRKLQVTASQRWKLHLFQAITADGTRARLSAFRASWHAIVASTYVYSPMVTGYSVAVTTIRQNQDDQWFKQACQGQGYGVVSSPDDLFLLCRAGWPRHILKRCDRLSPISTFSLLIFFHSARIFFSLALSLSDGFLWLCL